MYQPYFTVVKFINRRDQIKDLDYDSFKPFIEINRNYSDPERSKNYDSYPMNTWAVKHNNLIKVIQIFSTLEKDFTMSTWEKGELIFENIEFPIGSRLIEIQNDNRKLQGLKKSLPFVEF